MSVRAPFGRRFRVGSLVLAIALVAAACSDDGVERDEEGAVTQRGNISVYEIEEGDCLEVPPDAEEEVDEVTVVPCAELHTHEAYLLDSTSLDDEFDVYPGAPDIEAVAAGVCFDAFDEFVGSDVVDSSLSFTYLYPTLLSWTENEDPDRTIVCMVVSEPRQETAAGSGE